MILGAHSLALMPILLIFSIVFLSSQSHAFAPAPGATKRPLPCRHSSFLLTSRSKLRPSIDYFRPSRIVHSSGCKSDTYQCGLSGMIRAHPSAENGNWIIEDPSSKSFYETDQYKQRMASMPNKTIVNRSVNVRFSPEQLRRVQGIYDALQRALAQASRFTGVGIEETSSDRAHLSLEDLRADDVPRDISASQQEAERVRSNFPSISEEGFLVVEARKLP